MAILHESLKKMRLRDENFTQDHVVFERTGMGYFRKKYLAH